MFDFLFQKKNKEMPLTFRKQYLRDSVCPCDDTHDNVPSAFNCNAAIAAVGVLQSPATINIGDVKVGKSGFINGNGNPRLVTFSRKYSLFFTTPLIICL